jgi:hypothetical protein
MLKSGPVVSFVLLLLLIVPGILVWRVASFISDTPASPPDSEAGARAEAGATAAGFTERAVPDASPHILNNSTDSGKSGHYESIEEIIARIKRDVIVTGTVTGTQGTESAIFRIERMPDRSFDINTQLMDGFIITRISHNQITLKNQSGDESFSMPVESGKSPQ